MKFESPKKVDFISSLVVFIIAVPLSLGIALASGAPPAAGLIAAMMGGIITGLFAGAPLSVTGPAAGLSALVFQIVQAHGLEGLAIITAICGLLQITMGTIRAGKIFSLIPKPVLEGTLSAIGLIIVLGQLHILAGARIPKSPTLSFLKLPETYSAAFGGEQGIIAPVLLCGLVAIAVQVLWTKYATRFKIIPGALPAVIAATLLAALWEMPRVELAPLLPTLQEGTAKVFSFSWLAQLPGYIPTAIGLAVVASAESMLTARAIDTIIANRPGFVPCDLNRELRAQGLGNLASGMVGGIPMTGVMVRSAANINAGAVTRWSTVLHGTWIAIIVGVLPFVLTPIPLTALAAVLILTGVKLINFPHFVAAFKQNRVEGLVWLFTAGAIFATDLLKGLFIGIGAYVLAYFICKAMGKPLHAGEAAH